MLEFYNDNGTLSISTRTYPLALYKSFTMTVTTKRVQNNNFYADPAPNGVRVDRDVIVFYRHNIPNAIAGVWYDMRDNNDGRLQDPYTRTLWMCSNIPGTISIWMCKLITGMPADPAKFGLELYDAAGVRTFSTNTRAIPFVRSVLPFQASTGTLPNVNMAMGWCTEAFYAAFDNPYLLFWTQGGAFNGSSYKFWRIGYIHYGGPMGLLTQDKTDATQAQVPALFIDTGRLPMPFG